MIHIQFDPSDLHHLSVGELMAMHGEYEAACEMLDKRGEEGTGVLSLALHQAQYCIEAELMRRASRPGAYQA